MRSSTWFISALVVTLAALIMAAGASAATVRISITGTVTTGPSDPATVDLAAASDLGGTNPTGTITTTFPTALPGAPTNVLHGDVANGCVRHQGNLAVVVGQLPPHEQWFVPGFGTIEYNAAVIEDNGVAGASPVDRGRPILLRATSKTNWCTTMTFAAFAALLIDIESGDVGLGYTDQLDGFPAKPDATASVINPNGLSVAITDEPDGTTGEGLNLAVGPGSGSAEISTCSTGQTFVAAGSEIVVTCGSLILEVVTGSADVVLEGGLAVVSIPDEGVAEITENPDGSFTVENQGPTPIEVTVDGESETIEPDETSTFEAWDFQGFTGLAGPPVLNKANAGSNVALKWRILDASGAPVTDLSAAAITVTDVDCTTGADRGNARPGQSGGLQNLGGGNYQLNWKTQKSWAGTCKAMHLDIGDGVTHDAFFEFK